MTTEEIIWLARQAGLTGLMEGGIIDSLERFAATVADVERARTVLADFEVAERQIAAEREACARVVEQYCGAWDEAGYELAQTIRARGQE